MRKKKSQLVEAIDTLTTPVTIAPPADSEGRLPSPTRAHAMCEETARLSLTHVSFVEQAAEIIQQVLEGRLIGETKHIKTSDILRACEMIYDRFEPAKKYTETNIFFVQNVVTVITESLPQILEKYTSKEVARTVLNELAEVLSPES